MVEYIKREKIWPALNAASVSYNRATQKVIESIPADDVRPVVRGKWINPRPDSEMCSVCRTRFSISSLFAVGSNEEPNFCPNCGADMRGETNEI